MIGGVIGAVIGGGLSLYNSKRLNDKLVSYYKEQSNRMVSDYYYNYNELDKAGVRAFDQLRQSLFQLSSNALRNNAMVENAVLQSGVEGRSSNAIIRDVKAQTDRQKGFAEASYGATIGDLNSSATNLYLNTQQQLDDLQDTIEDQMVSASEAIMKSIPASMQGFMMGAGVGKGFSSMSSAMSSGGSFISSLGSGMKAMQPYLLGAMYINKFSGLVSNRGYY